MVARIYTPLMPQPTFRPPLGPQGAYGDAGSPFDGGEFDTQRQSKGLVTVAEQAQTQKIQLGSILQDFKSTMGALGAHDSVKTEVEAYLNIVDLQARKDAPSVPLIKETLRTAAKSLDGFITQALGQPSRVVGDWVDALLMQNIDYKYSPTEVASPSSATASPSGSASAVSTEASSDAGLAVSYNEATAFQSTGVSTGSLSEMEKTALKDFIESSRAQSQRGDYKAAEVTLQQGLELVAGKDRPDVEGKIHNLLGQLYDKTKQPDAALGAYQKAVERFQQCNQPQKQAQVLYAMASLYDEKGKLQQAAHQYEGALALDRALGNTRGIARTLNDLGSVYLRQGKAMQAVETLTDAFRETSRPEGEKALIPDIFSNLGAAHRVLQQYPQALNAYQVSLDHAIRQRDTNGAVTTLQNIAALYLEVNKPERALSFLQRAQGLSAKNG